MQQQQFSDTYTHADAEGHRHIRGANLGVSAIAYARAGGFAALASSEDVALVRALETCGASIARSMRPRVVTSSRVQGRARSGFADAVRKVLDGAIAHSSALRWIERTDTRLGRLSLSTPADGGNRLLQRRD